MSRLAMRYLPLLLLTTGLHAAPILGTPDGDGHYQMLLFDIPDPPQKRIPTAAELEGLDAALFNYFSTFDWFAGPIRWQAHDSNSAGAIVGSVSGGNNWWHTDFLYENNVVSSTLLDGGVLWDINEAGVAVGGSAMDGVARLCHPGLICEDGDYLTRTQDPRSAYRDDPWAFELFTHIDDSGNIWGIGNATGVYLHAGPVDFSQDIPEAHSPEPSTWLLAALGLCGFGAVRHLRANRLKAGNRKRRSFE